MSRPPPVPSPPPERERRHHARMLEILAPPLLAAASLALASALAPGCAAGCAGDDSAAAPSTTDPCATVPPDGEPCSDAGANCSYCSTWNVHYQCEAQDGGPPAWRVRCCWYGNGPHPELGTACGPFPVTCQPYLYGCQVYYYDCTAEGWRETQLRNCYECGPEYACPAGGAPPAQGSVCSQPCSGRPIWPCEYGLTTACGASTASAWCTTAGWEVQVDCPCDAAGDEPSCVLNPRCQWANGECLSS
jgi:hypothetical protein